MGGDCPIRGRECRPPANQRRERPSRKSWRGVKPQARHQDGGPTPWTRGGAEAQCAGAQVSWGASRRGGPAGEGRGSPPDSFGTPRPAMGQSPNLSAGLREASFPAGVPPASGASLVSPVASSRVEAPMRFVVTPERIDEAGLSECGRWKGRGAVLSSWRCRWGILGIEVCPSATCPVEKHCSRPGVSKVGPFKMCGLKTPRTPAVEVHTS